LPASTARPNCSCNTPIDSLGWRRYLSGTLLLLAALDGASFAQGILPGRVGTPAINPGGPSRWANKSTSAGGCNSLLQVGRGLRSGTTVGASSARIFKACRLPRFRVIHDSLCAFLKASSISPASRATVSDFANSHDERLSIPCRLSDVRERVRGCGWPNSVYMGAPPWCPHWGHPGGESGDCLSARLRASVSPMGTRKDFILRWRCLPKKAEQ